MGTRQAIAATDPESVALRSIQLVSEGEFADFEEVVHPKAVNHDHFMEPPEARVSGPDGWLAAAQWLRTAFADLRFEPNCVVVDGDMVVVRGTATGRHVATLVTYNDDGEIDMALPATRKSFSVTESHWIRVADGKVRERWGNRDDLGQSRQLGWIPPSPAYLLKMAQAKKRARQDKQE